MWTVDTLSVVEESAIQEGQLEVGEEVTALYMRKAYKASILCIGKQKKKFSFSTAHY